MYKKFIFAIMLVATFVICGDSYAATAEKPATKPAAKAATKAAKPVEKPVPAKKVQSEDEKYAQVYEKCTKEAETNEAKYDQLFNACMDKNGFPQEEYDTGGQPISEGQDN